MPRPRVDRSAFLYLDPKGAEGKFAQCGVCMMWTGPDRRRCTIHGASLVVERGDTCGFYIHGEPMPDAPVHTSVIPRESGFERRQVRCENCRFFDASVSKCGLFRSLNEKLPGLFDLDEDVDQYGCCNANTVKGLV